MRRPLQTTPKRPADGSADRANDSEIGSNQVAKTKWVELAPEELGYLLRVIREPLTYYSRLTEHPRASPASRENARLLKSLWAKLSE